MGLGLADVRDRTGVSVAVLEALETGDLSQAPSLDGARTGLRRYADLVGLDGDALARSLDPYWGPAALVGATGGAGPTAPGSGSGSGSSSSSGSVLDPSTGAGFAGHLRRYPGEGAHLQAFTQTAEVPSVGSPRGAGDDPYGSGQVFGTTGMFPATPPLHIRQVVRPAAWPVRALVWLVVGALVISGLGLVVSHVRPAWMRTLHLARVPHSGRAPSSSNSVAAGGAPGTRPPGTSSTGSSVVTTGVPGPDGSIPVTVRAAQYTVLVQASARCWVQASVPNNPVPVLNTVLDAGTNQVVNPVNGQLTLQLGASGVTVVVQVAGKTVRGWSYTPTAAPITLAFTTTS